MALTQTINDHFTALEKLLVSQGSTTLPTDIHILCQLIEDEYQRLFHCHAELRTQLRWKLQHPENPVFREMMYIQNLLNRFYPARRKVFMRAVEILAANERQHDTITLLSKVLRTRPDLQDVHRMLSSDLFSNGSSTEAGNVSERHRLIFRESFGAGVMTYPYGACVDSDRGRLFVSDHNTGELHRFDLDTKEHTSLRGDWGSLMGICLDDQGAVWICDIQDRSLIRIDQNSRIIGRIYMRNLLGDEESSKPEFVSVEGEMVHVLAADSRRHNVKAYSFNMSDPTTTLIRHPALGILGPAGIQFKGKHILYASVLPPCVYTVDISTGETRKIYTNDAIYNYQFTVLDNNIFITHPGSLAHIDKDGRMIWNICLPELFGEPVSAQGIAVMGMKTGDTILFLVDYIGKRILEFNV